MKPKLKIFLFCSIFSIFIIVLIVALIFVSNDIKKNRQSVFQNYISIHTNNEVPDTYLRDMDIKIFSIEKLPEFSIDSENTFEDIILITTEDTQSIRTYFQVHFDSPGERGVKVVSKGDYLSVIIPLGDKYEQTKDIRFSYNRTDKAYKLNV